jgi:hypothetical protein
MHLLADILLGLRHLLVHFEGLMLALLPKVKDLLLALDTGLGQLLLSEALKIFFELGLNFVKLVKETLLTLRNLLRHLFRELLSKFDTNVLLLKVLFFHGDLPLL